MTLRTLAVLVVASLVVPTDALAQQGTLPWVIPGIPNPFLPAPAPSGSPSAPAPAASPPGSAPSAAGPPVVLELFTSEDCAACESAEYTMNRLLVTQPVVGARVIPLALHVEFYGGAGGTDPYVLAAATRRQQAYDASRGRVYTPQAIVDGDRELLGSEDASLRTAIAAAARQPKVSVDVSRSPRSAGPTGLALSIRYGASPGRRPATLTVLLTESGLVEMHHGGQTAYDRTPLAPVVRAIQEAGSANVGGGSAEATVAIPQATVRANATAVVLLQDTSTRHILGVGTIPAGPP